MSLARIRVRPGNKLAGTVDVPGAKNSVLKLMAACLMADGDFFTKTNLDTRSLVVVLGATPAATLFPDGDAVGKTIKLNQLNYRVIGLLGGKGGSGFGNDDDVAMIPITTFQTRLSSQRTNQGGQTVQTINVQVVDEKQIGRAHV